MVTADNRALRELAKRLAMTRSSCSVKPCPLRRRSAGSAAGTESGRGRPRPDPSGGRALATPAAGQSAVRSDGRASSPVDRAVGRRISGGGDRDGQDTVRPGAPATAPSHTPPVGLRQNRALGGAPSSSLASRCQRIAAAPNRASSSPHPRRVLVHPVRPAQPGWRANVL